MRSVDFRWIEFRRYLSTAFFFWKYLLLGWFAWILLVSWICSRNWWVNEISVPCFWFAGGKNLFLLGHWLNFNYRCLGSFCEDRERIVFTRTLYLVLKGNENCVSHFMSGFLDSLWYTGVMGGKINTMLLSLR